jgi:chromosome partitioning protein
VADIIALANQKGGVGKTTSCVNLAAALALSGQKVLVIDLDPQGNATVGSGVDKKTLVNSVTEVLLSECSITQAIIPQTEGGYALLPTNTDLTAAEVQLLSANQRERCLANAVAQIKENYDFILIDCPPSLNMLTLNALVTASFVLIPMQCEYYAMEGLTALMNTIEELRSGPNPSLQLLGVLRTMYDPRNRLSQDVSEQLTQYLGSKLFETVIPRNVRLAEAPSHGLPIIQYDFSSRGSIAYLGLAKELLARQLQTPSVTTKKKAAVVA